LSFAFVIKVKGLEKLPEKLKRFRVGVLARVQKMLEESADEVAGNANEDYLRGPRSKTALGVVSGDLGRSVKRGGKGNHYKLTGNRVVIGTNLPYAAIHEFGFSGTVKVPAHTRNGFNVRSHSRRLVMPPRPFLNPALRDSTGAIRTIISRLTNEALKEAMA